MGRNHKQQAKRAFDIIKECLDDHAWNYKVDARNLRLDFDGTGDDLEMNFRICVSENGPNVTVYSTMPFDVPPKRWFDMVMSVNLINDSIIDGCFDFGILDGCICYRNTLIFWDMDVTKETYWFLMMRSAKVIDTFNEKLMMIAKGMYTVAQLEEFVKTV